MIFKKLSLEEYLSSPDASYYRLSGKEFQVWYTTNDFSNKSHNWDGGAGSIISEDVIVEYCFVKDGIWRYVSPTDDISYPLERLIYFRVVEGYIDCLFAEPVSTHTDSD